MQTPPSGPLVWLNCIRSDQLITENQLCTYLTQLCVKSHSVILLSVQAFFHSDEEGNGLVSKKELRELLYSYALPITANQFEKIWSR